MHKLKILGILVFCIKIVYAQTSSPLAPTVATTTTTTTTTAVKPQTANDVNMFEFIRASFFNFIQDNEDPNRMPKYDLTKEIPRSFFKFITGTETANATEEGGILNDITNELMKFTFDDDNEKPPNDEQNGKMNSDDVDVWRFVFLSFFRYITDTEDGENRVTNIYDGVLKLFF